MEHYLELLQGVEMPTIPHSLINLNADILVAVDVETTGRLAGYHEIIQIAVVPLNSDITPVEHINPFYMNIAPEHPERCENEASSIHGLDIEELVNNCPDQWAAADYFDDWFKALELPYKKKMAPLAHNWAFEKGFLSHWLGLESFDQLFHFHPRDSMLFGISINDAAAYHGMTCPFPYVGLKAMCKKYNIEVPHSHDALCDALCEAKLYKAMLESMGR